jgi:hypothetical protein
VVVLFKLQTLDRALPFFSGDLLCVCYFPADKSKHFTIRRARTAFLRVLKSKGLDRRARDRRLPIYQSETHTMRRRSLICDQTQAFALCGRVLFELLWRTSVCAL